MRPPIFVFEGWQTEAFLTREKAESQYEAYIIPECTAYDADGFLLQMVQVSVHGIEIRDTEPRENRADELREKLIYHLAEVNYLPQEWLERASLTLEEIVVHMTPKPKLPKKPFLQRLFRREMDRKAGHG